VRALLADPSHVPPAWSPDSRHIAYSTTTLGGSGIHVASVAEGEARYVAGSGQGAGFPVWSPDGQWIGFRAAFDGRTRLTVVRPDGTDQRELVSIAGIEDAFTQIAWSPDSTRLVYHRPHPDKPRIVAVVDLAGTERQLSPDGVTSGVPTWSPDGRRIAYLEEFDLGGDKYDERLVVIAPDGADRRDFGPVASCVAWWSPDSRYLISYGEECFAAEVALIPVDGDEPIQTVQLARSIVGAPSWQRIAEPLFPWQ
jgi:dipeptidyl aminopeptidase/acylaminoacyl peptidase